MIGKLSQDLKMGEEEYVSKEREATCCAGPLYALGGGYLNTTVGECYYL
jgi:hypothetical protein